MDNIDDYITRVNDMLSRPSTSKNSNVPLQEQTNLNKTAKENDSLLFTDNYNTHEQIESLVKRVVILHTKGIYKPPHKCHKNKRKFNSNEKTDRPNKILKTTVGTGQVGATCEKYGIKNCGCCCIPHEEDYLFDQTINTKEISKEKNTEVQLYVDLTKQITQPPIIMDDSVISISDSDGSDEVIALENDEVATNTSPIPKIENNLDETDITEHFNPDESVANYIDRVTGDYNEEEMRNFEDHLTADILLKDDLPDILLNDDLPDIKTEKKEADEVVPNYADVENITDYIDLVTSSYDLESIHSDNIEIENLPNLTPTKENIIPCKKSQKDDCKENVSPAPNVEDWSTQLICPICLDPLREKEIMSTICGHLFCSECIKSVIKQTKACPNCRKKLTLKNIHPIYLG